MFKSLLVWFIITISLNSYSYTGVIKSGYKVIKSSKILRNSIKNIIKNSKSLSNDEIIKLANMTNKIKGTKLLGKHLGKMKLSKGILRDTYLRIAIAKKNISRVEAEEIWIYLKKTKGVRSTLSKIVGRSPEKTAGHLHELQLARKASKQGFDVLEIGKKFSDGLKKAPTDIDLLLKRGGKIFAIETKNYKATRKIPLDMFRADLDTLVRYKKTLKGEKVVPVFSMTSKPSNRKYLKILENEAKKRDVQLIFGNSTEQIIKLEHLGEIL